MKLCCLSDFELLDSLLMKTSVVAVFLLLFLAPVALHSSWWIFVISENACWWKQLVFYSSQSLLLTTQTLRFHLSKGFSYLTCLWHEDFLRRHSFFYHHELFQKLTIIIYYSKQSISFSMLCHWMLHLLSLL